jgi:Bacterial transcriptional activator domain
MWRVSRSTHTARRRRPPTQHVPAGGEAGEARRLATEALGLWREAALAEVADAPLAADPQRELDERRLDEAETLIRARVSSTGTPRSAVCSPPSSASSRGPGLQALRVGVEPALLSPPVLIGHRCLLRWFCLASEAAVRHGSA